jgi:hypothetical protein
MSARHTQTCDGWSNESLISGMASLAVRNWQLDRKHHPILGIYNVQIPTSLYCRALATGVHAEYLGLTLLMISMHPEIPSSRNVRAVWLVSRAAPGQRRTMLLWLPDANLTLEQLVLRRRFVDHVRHPSVPSGLNLRAVVRSAMAPCL